MKKLISVILCIVLICTAFAACSAPKKEEKPSETATAAVTEVATTAAAPVPATEAAASTTVSATAAAGTTAAVTNKAGVTVTQGTTAKAANNKKNKKAKAKKKTTVTTTKAQPQYINIVLLKNRKAKCSSPNVALATGEVVIDKPGDYRITSKTNVWHGQIVLKLKNTEKAELRFENVNIQNNTPNIIQIIDTSINTNRSFLETEGSAGTTADDEIKEISDFDLAPNVQISFPEKTSSTFSSTANSITGVIYNESKLIIKGHGNAYINSEKNVNNCICSTKSMKIRNLNLYLTSAQNTNTGTLASTTGAARGIFSYSKVTLESGNLNIKTNGDAIRCDEFVAENGTASLRSSACDAVDADDAIVINGGSITATALEKACFKVRRINNTEKRNQGDTSIKANDCIRSGKGDTFAINGGTVKGEGKRVTTVQKASKQPVLTCKIVKPSKGTAAAKNESKVPAIIEIKGVKKSTNKCTKLVYSASGLTQGKAYKATANGKSADCKWNGTAGIIDIESTNNR